MESQERLSENVTFKLKLKDDQMQTPWSKVWAGTRAQVKLHCQDRSFVTSDSRILGHFCVWEPWGFYTFFYNLDVNIYENLSKIIRQACQEIFTRTFVAATVITTETYDNCNFKLTEYTDMPLQLKDILKDSVDTHLLTWKDVHV